MENSKAEGRLKWRIVALCWGALVMTSMIRISLGIAAPTLMKEFDISPSTMGYVLSGWNWAYTALQLERALDLARCLAAAYELADILGYEDISPGRKSDPAPAFPLEKIRAAVLDRAAEIDPAFPLE